jgi:hypothetical protein
MKHALADLVLAACGGDLRSDIDSGAGDDGAGDDVTEYRSSTRIRRRMGRTPDGGEMFLGRRDTMRAEDCGPHADRRRLRDSRPPHAAGGRARRRALGAGGPPRARHAGPRESACPQPRGPPLDRRAADAVPRRGSRTSRRKRHPRADRCPCGAAPSAAGTRSGKAAPLAVRATAPALGRVRRRGPKAR